MIIVERDSQLVIDSILRLNQAPKQIRNSIEDINIHVKDLTVIEFTHCCRTINNLTDRLAIKLISIISRTLILRDFLEFLFEENRIVIEILRDPGIFKNSCNLLELIYPTHLISFALMVTTERSLHSVL